MMPANKKTPRRIGPVETLVGLAVLLVLIGLAVSIYRQRKNYDPNLFNLNPALLASPAVAATPVGAVLGKLGGELSLTAGPLEAFNADTLWQKIDGKDQAFFAYGFVGLEAMAFTRGPLSFEVYAYDMGRPNNALGAYSQMRSPRDRSWQYRQVTGSQGENTLLFYYGPYFIELIGETKAPELLNLMEKMAQRLIDAVPLKTEALGVAAFFPRENLVAQSLGFQPENFSGLDFFDKVFTARYQAGPEELVAYLSQRDNPQASLALKEKLRAFWRNNGVQVVAEESVEGVPVLIADVYGVYQSVFCREDLIGGIAEGKEISTIRLLTQRLLQSLMERK